MSLASILRAIKNVARNVFAHETLEERPNLGAPREPRRRFAAMLFRREPLALEPAAAAATPRPGLLRALFVPEALPEEPPRPERPGRAAWLRWLFRFERLDPP